VGVAYDEMVESGYRAAKAWDGRLNKKVGYRQPNNEALYVLWVFSLLETIFYGTFDGMWFVFSGLCSLLLLPFAARSNIQHAHS